MKMKMMKFLMNLKKWLNPKKNKSNIMIMIIMTLLILRKKSSKLIISILMTIKLSIKMKENKKITITIMERINKCLTILPRVNGHLINNLSFLCLKINSHLFSKKPIPTLSFNKNNKPFNKKEIIFKFVSQKIWNVKIKLIN